MLEQARFGANIITISDYGALMDIVPDLGVINAPYLSQSFEKNLNFCIPIGLKDLVSN